MRAGHDARRTCPQLQCKPSHDFEAFRLMRVAEKLLNKAKEMAFRELKSQLAQDLQMDI